MTNDAARELLGGPWKMPSSDDIVELFNYTEFVDESGAVIPDETTNKQTVVNNVIGVLMRSRINGAVLFIAASGSGLGRTWSSKGLNIDIWSANAISTATAIAIRISQTIHNPRQGLPRDAGRPIRPIWNPSNLR